MRRYVNEFAFRLNERYVRNHTMVRLDHLFENAVGKAVDLRRTYKIGRQTMSRLTKLRNVWSFIVKLGKYAVVIAIRLLLIITILLLFFTFAYTTDRAGDFNWSQEFDTKDIFEQLAK